MRSSGLKYVRCVSRLLQVNKLKGVELRSVHDKFERQCAELGTQTMLTRRGLLIPVLVSPSRISFGQSEASRAASWAASRATSRAEAALKIPPPPRPQLRDLVVSTFRMLRTWVMRLANGSPDEGDVLHLASSVNTDSVPQIITAPEPARWRSARSSTPCRCRSESAVVGSTPSSTPVCAGGANSTQKWPVQNHFDIESTRARVGSPSRARPPGALPGRRQEYSSQLDGPYNQLEDEPEDIPLDELLNSLRRHAL